MKDVLREVEHATAGGTGDRAADRAALLAPLQKWTPPHTPESGSIVILRSPELFVTFSTPRQLPAVAAAGDRFHIRRILPVISFDREFYLLALGKNRTRLLNCTATTSGEMAFGAGTPVSLSEFMQTRQPDHTLENRSSGGPATGSMKGVVFGTSSDADDEDEYLLHFFKAIDKGVHAVLRDSRAPLVPVAVEHELALYRRVNTYQHLVEPGVAGAPDGFKGGEMHARALHLAQSHMPEDVGKAMQEFDKLVGAGRASIDAQEIVKAASGGRVSHVYLKDGAEDGGKVDLLNDAVVETLRHGGEVRVLGENQMPPGATICARFRYAATN
jgi:hypothetical protein